VETTEHNATKLLLVNATVAQQGLECITAKGVYNVKGINLTFL
jgi:hypothetical protein